MTDTRGSHRNRLIITLCSVVFIATMVGIFSYVSRVESINDKRATLSQNVCNRQDGIINVLSFLVSEERQKLIQQRSTSEPSEELKESNEVIRSLVQIIKASPC